MVRYVRAVLLKILCLALGSPLLRSVRGEDVGVCSASSQGAGDCVAGALSPAEAQRLWPGLRTIDFSREGDAVGACVDERGRTRRMPIKYKKRQGEALQAALDEDSIDPAVIAVYVCTLDTTELSRQVLDTLNETFDEDVAAVSNAGFSNRKKTFDNFKKGTKQTMLIFSDRLAETTYHFPYLKEWLPLIQEEVLGPLGIPLEKICRMQMTLMPLGTEIKRHPDAGPWVRRCHRTHIPLLSSGEVYFISAPKDQYFRIPSKVGVVFEVNNAIPHLVQNFGPDRVHLIIDWTEQELSLAGELAPGTVCDYNGNDGIVCPSERAK